MKSYDYEAYTTQNGGVICTDCTGKLTEAQQEEKGFRPIFADSEWDYYPTCDMCNKQIDYVNLTSDGRKYEAQNKKKSKKSKSLLKIKKVKKNKK
jgi:hypothetical protein